MAGRRDEQQFLLHNFMLRIMAGKSYLFHLDHPFLQERTQDGNMYRRLTTQRRTHCAQESLLRMHTCAKHLCE